MEQEYENSTNLDGWIRNWSCHLDVIIQRMNAWWNDEPLDQLQAAVQLQDITDLLDEIDGEAEFTGCWA